MNGRQGKDTNAQIWGNYEDSNYDGSCTWRHFRFGSFRSLDFCWTELIISGWILLRMRKSKHACYGQYILLIKLFRVWVKLEKYGRAGQATDDIIQRMLFARWITKATLTLTHTHTKTLTHTHTHSLTHTHTLTHTFSHTHSHTHTHTLRICNTFCSSTTTIVARTRLVTALRTVPVLLNASCQLLSRPFAVSHCLY